MAALNEGMPATAGAALTVGQLLARRRSERGLDLADIARESRIPLRHLDAIERDLHEKLPALPYAVGFVRSYARTLGLAPDSVVAQFKSETAIIDTAAQQASFPEPLEDSRIPAKALAIGSLVLALLAIGGWLLLSRAPEAPVAQAEATAAAEEPAATQPAPPVLSDSAAPPLAEVTAEPAPDGLAAMPADAALGQAAVDPNAVATTVAPTAPANPLPGVAGLPAPSGMVVLRATEETWIRVRENGQVLKMGVLAAGETFNAPARPGVEVRTGNAGGLQLQLGTRVLPPIGIKGQSVTVSLDPAQLGQSPAAAPARPQ
jgi:cytoskeleton protein RodZ